MMEHSISRILTVGILTIIVMAVDSLFIFVFGHVSMCVTLHMPIYYCPE